jgi:hypothetical protein
MFVIYFKPMKADHPIEILSFAATEDQAELEVVRCAVEYVRQCSGDIRANDPYSKPDYGLYLVNLGPRLIKLNTIIVQRQPAGFFFGETLTANTHEVGYIMTSTYNETPHKPERNTVVVDCLIEERPTMIKPPKQTSYTFLDELRGKLGTQSLENRDD